MYSFEKQDLIWIYILFWNLWNVRGFAECTFEWIHVIKDANPELLQILTMLMVEGKVTSWKTSDVQTDGRENDIVFLQNWAMFDPRKKQNLPLLYPWFFLIGIHEQNLFHIPKLSNTWMTSSWWLNHPFEKYARQIWIISPKTRGVNKKCFKPPPDDLYYLKLPGVFIESLWPEFVIEIRLSHDTPDVISGTWRNSHLVEFHEPGSSFCV